VRHRMLPPRPALGRRRRRGRERVHSPAPAGLRATTAPLSRRAEGAAGAPRRW
jgi:hypothetical protein